MPMDGEDIQQRIEQAFPDAKVVMVDLAGDGDHWAARVTSEAFRGKSRIAQHKLVYAASERHLQRVLLGGETVVENGNLLDLDLDELGRRAPAILAGVLQRAGLAR